MALKCPARYTMSCRSPSSAVRSWSAFHDCAGGGPTLVGGTPWLVISESAPAAPTPALSEVCTALAPSVRKSYPVTSELVALQHAVGEEGVDHAGDLGRRLDEPAHRQIGDGQRDALELQLRRRPVGVLREVVVEPQAGLRRTRVEHRRHVAGLRAEPRGVGVAEEGDDVVGTDDHDVVDGRVGVAVVDDDVADGLGDEVLGVRAAGVLVGLLVEVGDAWAGPDVDDPPVDTAWLRASPAGPASWRGSPVIRP